MPLRAWAGTKCSSLFQKSRPGAATEALLAEIVADAEAEAGLELLDGAQFRDVFRGAPRADRVEIHDLEGGFE